jgi:hypothetical protein
MSTRSAGGLAPDGGEEAGGGEGEGGQEEARLLESRLPERQQRWGGGGRA